jgi:hypothetical protein
VRESSNRRKVFEVTRWENPDLGRSSLHSFDDWARPQMAELRERYQLAAVVAEGRTQLEQQLAMLAWVHNRWAHDGWTHASKPDGLTVLREAAEGKRFACVEYSRALAHALIAVGFPARAVGLSREGVSYGMGKGHVVTEVWNDELGKWILLDGQNNVVWRHGDGDVPLDAEEVRGLYRRRSARKLHMNVGPSSWRQEPPQPREWLRYFYHLRYAYENTLFDASQGGAATRPGHVVLVGKDERPELLFQGGRVRQSQSGDRDSIYPALNLTHCDIETTSPGRAPTNILSVRLTHSCPWFAHFRVEIEGVRREHTEDHLAWALAPGENTLEVRAVNQAGTLGRPSRVVVVYWGEGAAETPAPPAGRGAHAPALSA